MSWAASMSLDEIAHGGLFADGDWVESKDQDPSGSVRLTQLADVGVGEFRHRSNRWMRPDQSEGLGCTYLEPQDVLIARMPDPIGRACTVPPSIGKAVTAVDVAILRIRRPDIDARYVMWAINSPSFRARVEAQQSGTTRKRISRKNLARLTIPVPSIDEQRQIVAALDGHFARLVVAETGLATASAKGAAFWRSELAAIRRRVASSPMQPIGSVATTTLGKMLDAKRQTGDPVPYLRNINVRWGSFALEDVKTTLLTPDDVARFDVQPGDVMVCEGGEPGRCAVWRGPRTGLAFQKALHRIRVPAGADISPDFLCLMLTEAIQSRRYDHLLTGTTIKHLPQQRLREIPIPVPPLAEQNQALARAAEAETALERLGSAVNVSQGRAIGLRKSLLAAAVSGLLVEGDERSRRVQVRV